VTDPEERAARHVADAGGLDDDGARLTGGEAGVPVDDVRGDLAILGGPPRDHGGHPGALVELTGADVDRREPPAGGGLGGVRPARRRDEVADLVRRGPHRRPTVAARGGRRASGGRWRAG